MAVEKVFGQLICKCERCEPPKVWMPKGNTMPKTCAECRSTLWNKKKLQTKILQMKDTPQAALQCAIIYEFDCEYYRQRIPASALCKVCFTLPVWNDKAKIAGLLEAFKTDEPVEEKDLPDITLDPIREEMINEANGDRVIQTKTPEEILKEMETREIKKPETSILREDGKLPPITGGKAPQKTDEKFIFTSNARGCTTKYQDADLKWQCNFFTHKTKNPQYPYCKLCWELPEIWGERAVGFQK